MLRNHLNESNASSNSKTNNNMSNTKVVGTSSTKAVTPTFTWHGMCLVFIWKN